MNWTLLNNINVIIRKIWFLPVVARFIAIAAFTPFIYIAHLGSVIASFAIGLIITFIAYLPLPLRIHTGLKLRSILICSPLLCLLLGSFLISVFTYSGEVNWFGYHKKAGIFEYFLQVIMFLTNWEFIGIYLTATAGINIVFVIIRFKSRMEGKVGN